MPRAPLLLDRGQGHFLERLALPAARFDFRHIAYLAVRPQPATRRGGAIVLPANRLCVPCQPLTHALEIIDAGYRLAAQQGVPGVGAVSHTQAARSGRAS